MARNVKRADSTTVEKTEDDLIDLPPESDIRFAYGIKKNPRKKLYLVCAVLAAISLIILAIILLTRGDSSSEEAPQESVAALESIISVDSIVGPAEVSIDGGESWQPVTTDTTLNEQDKLRVSSEGSSKVSLLFSDNSFARLSSGSELTVNQNKDGRMELALDSGSVYVRLSRSSGIETVIVTDTVEVLAVGTAYMVRDQSPTGVDVYEGSVRELLSDTAITQGKRFSSGQLSEIVRAELKRDAFVVWNRQQDINASFSGELGILEDIEAPDLSITSPVNNARIEVPAGSSSVAIEIIGTTESGAVVKAESNSSGTAEVTADETGAFTVTMTGSEGVITYTVTSKDRSGNVSTLPVIVELVKEVVEAKAPDITLGAISQQGAGIVANWTYRNDFEAPDGVRVLWNKQGSLSYPVESSSVDTSSQSTDSSTIRLAQESGCSKDSAFGSKASGAGTSAAICVLDGDTYFVRVCRYDSSTDTCDIYSNEVRIKAPES